MGTMDKWEQIKNENGLTDEEKKQVGDALNTYMKGASRGTLSTDEIDSLMKALNTGTPSFANAQVVEEAEERFREKLESGFFNHDNSSDDFEMLKYRSVLVEAKNEIEGYYIKDDWYNNKVIYKAQISRIEIGTCEGKEYIDIIITYIDNYELKCHKYNLLDEDSKKKLLSFLGEKIL